MSVLQLLTASYLPSNLPIEGLRQTVRAARVRAESLGLTGGLLFDGEKFVQLIAGPERAARQALAALRADAGHERLRDLYADHADTAPTRRDWRVGYTEPAELDAVLAASDKGLALQAFEQTMRRAELA